MKIALFIWGNLVSISITENNIIVLKFFPEKKEKCVIQIFFEKYKKIQFYQIKVYGIKI